jgi:hypothetical protein
MLAIAPLTGLIAVRVSYDWPMAIADGRGIVRLDFILPLSVVRRDISVVDFVGKCQI